MTNLIKITETENGKAVSARELYDQLGYDSTHFSRWAKRNIVNNDFAIENEDYIKVARRANSNDYAVSLSFGKELCMLSKTKKAKQIRLYFIECEKIAKNKELPQTFAQALRLAAEQQEKIELQQKLIGVQQKEVEAIKEKNWYLQVLNDKEWDKRDREELYPKRRY